MSIHPRNSAGLRIRRYVPVIAILLGLVGFAYACSGAVMAGSFASAAADTAATDYWRRVVIWYQGAAGAFLVVALVAAGVLARRAVRTQTTVAVAAVLAGAGACGSPAPEKPAQGVAMETAVAASPARDSVTSGAEAPAPGTPQVDTTLFGSVRLILADTTLAPSEGRRRTTTSLMEHVNSSGDYSHTLLDAQRSGDGWIYLLIRTTGLSRLHAPNGYCGAGEETDLVWAAVDPALRVAKAQSAPVLSCLRTRTPRDHSLEMSGEPWSIASYIPGDSLTTISFDRRHPERGLRMTTVQDTTRL